MWREREGLWEVKCILNCFFSSAEQSLFQFRFFLEPAGGESTLSRPYRDFPAGMISRTGEFLPDSAAKWWGRGAPGAPGVRRSCLSSLQFQRARACGGPMFNFSMAAKACKKTYHGCERDAERSKDKEGESHCFVSKRAKREGEKRARVRVLPFSFFL